MLILNSIYLTAVRYVSKATRTGMKLTNNKDELQMHLNNSNINKPTAAYIFASWGALAIGVLGYLIGLWNATLELNEKGYYFAVFLLAMFAAVTLQKTIRDKEEGIPVTNIFAGMCWFAFSSAIALLVVGLINATMLLSEKGFYGMSFVLSLFAIITIQKNIRDMTNEQGMTDPAAFPRATQGLDATLEAASIID
ncbi:inner membrane protein YiaA [Flocculibacter collagenilyticus]|uniref:inner membrane protein YiaA n=1 Tax=Flocculibacter collagenilyticus TaxID=2744479 RepID=UPI002279B436|nr:inner membrane protein YiaA [Flocculibacter collagenilyticus]